MLVNYETNPLQFDIDLENFVNLEHAYHQHNAYHFDNNLFVALFNQFTLRKKCGGVLPSKSEHAMTVNVGRSLVTLNAQSLR